MAGGGGGIIKPVNNSNSVQSVNNLYVSGNIGIGTSGPYEKLTVTNGNLAVANGNAIIGFSSSQGGVYVTKQSEYGTPAVQGITNTFAPGNLSLNPIGGNINIGNPGFGSSLSVNGNITNAGMISTFASAFAPNSISYSIKTFPTNGSENGLYQVFIRRDITANADSIFAYVYVRQASGVNDTLDITQIYSNLLTLSFVGTTLTVNNIQVPGNGYIYTMLKLFTI